VYEQLRANGGTVLIRGRGIVASRIIQRLWEERRTQPKIQVVHLHRSRLTQGHKFGLGKRKVENEFEFQPFNWPKACWTGEYREQLEKAGPDQRRELLAAWGGTTTASRRDWRDIIKEGLRDGWYRPEYGSVKAVVPGANGRIVTQIASTLAGGGDLSLEADFVIDCTGLVASPLISTYSLPLSVAGRLPVSNAFEIEPLRHGQSRLYSAGAMTLGGPQAAVDSFLGLQYAALKAFDNQFQLNLRGMRNLNGLYSFGQWWKWARGVRP
jgi:pSer/pThr/pTyr-binding forkhead associated (FHA) protein